MVAVKYADIWELWKNGIQNSLKAVKNLNYLCLFQFSVLDRRLQILQVTLFSGFCFFFNQRLACSFASRGYRIQSRKKKIKILKQQSLHLQKNMTMWNFTSWFCSWLWIAGCLFASGTMSPVSEQKQQSSLGILYPKQIQSTCSMMTESTDLSAVIWDACRV